MRINMTNSIIKSIRGGEKIAYKGYFYNYTHTEIGIKVWRCNRRGCKSAMKTSLDNFLIDVEIHEHLKDDVKYFRTLLKEKMKKRALSSDESNRNVVLSVLKENLSIKVPPDLKKLNDYVHKERKTSNFTVTNNYDIPVELQETVGGKQFL
ncbi:hypothetical protein NGRA_2360 [Nosema granulosis]|uniref:FLYWCH-type domain-containing protein n=1 Tax=Nosema granulosis TaxID=83296 RepID=A0A9P6GY99_9MICR|nr:hypothetical protein NGRA_2360 [Nosema granulosis]